MLTVTRSKRSPSMLQDNLRGEHPDERHRTSISISSYTLHPLSRCQWTLRRLQQMGTLIPLLHRICTQMTRPRHGSRCCCCEWTCLTICEEWSAVFSEILSIFFCAHLSDSWHVSRSLNQRAKDPASPLRPLLRAPTVILGMPIDCEIPLLPALPLFPRTRQDARKLSCERSCPASTDTDNDLVELLKSYGLPTEGSYDRLRSDFLAFIGPLPAFF